MSSVSVWQKTVFGRDRQKACAMNKPRTILDTFMPFHQFGSFCFCSSLCCVWTHKTSRKRTLHYLKAEKLLQTSRAQKLRRSLSRREFFRITIKVVTRTEIRNAF